ncbi:MAG TPA: protein-L-isoaspartate(D-aspartate) O-methyltransferase [Bacteroidia bacterium]
MITGDGYVEQGMRRQLVQYLREKGIVDEKVLEAIGKIPRHLFVDSALKELAYKDMALRIAADQTISQPYTVAFQTQMLQIKKGDKVLEIGTGSGYQAAVLQEVGAKVFSIERQKELFDKTKIFLNKLGYTPKMVYGDGFKGLPGYAPFHKIIITAAAPKVPEDLLNQLAPGGLMSIPYGEGESQKMFLIEKKLDGQLVKTEMGDFKFVPMLQGKSR